MIDLTFKGKHYEISGSYQSLILEMYGEILKLKGDIKKLEKRTPELKNCKELDLIKINGDFHLVHPDVVSLIQVLQAKKQKSTDELLKDWVPTPLK
jgi:hypothetical protein